MLSGLTIYIALVFVLAGVVKGATGLGLPTVSMGLLAIVMTPLQAAALVVLPTFVRVELAAASLMTGVPPLALESVTVPAPVRFTLPEIDRTVVFTVAAT